MLLIFSVYARPEVGGPVENITPLHILTLISDLAKGNCGYTVDNITPLDLA